MSDVPLQSIENLSPPLRRERRRKLMYAGGWIATLGAFLPGIQFIGTVSLFNLAQQYNNAPGWILVACGPLAMACSYIRWRWLAAILGFIVSLPAPWALAAILLTMKDKSLLFHFITLGVYMMLIGAFMSLAGSALLIVPRRKMIVT